MGRVADREILDKLDRGILCKASILHAHKLVDDEPRPDSLEPASLGVARPKLPGAPIADLA